jgi:hypothetical protein
LWAAVYGALIALTLICAALMWRAEHQDCETPNYTTDDPPDAWARARWVALAFVPSSLLAGTHYLTLVAGSPTCVCTSPIVRSRKRTTTIGP